MSPKNAATLTFIAALRVSPRHLTSDNLQGLKIFGGVDHEERIWTAIARELTAELVVRP
jgi:hypothetical protein